MSTKKRGRSFPHVALLFFLQRSLERARELLPADILEPPATGALHENLETAVEQALKYGDPAACVRLAQRYSWRKGTEQFLQNLTPA